MHVSIDLSWRTQIVPPLDWIDSSPWWTSNLFCSFLRPLQGPHQTVGHVSQRSVTEANTVNCSTRRHAAGTANYLRPPTSQPRRVPMPHQVWCEQVIETPAEPQVGSPTACGFFYQHLRNVKNQNALSTLSERRARWACDSRGMASLISTCHYLLPNIWSLAARTFSTPCCALLCAMLGAWSRPGERHISLASKNSPSHYCGPWDLGIIHRARLRCLYMSNLGNQAASLQSWSHTMARH